MRREPHPSETLTARQLYDLTQRYINESLAANTRRSYSTAERQYISFCLRIGADPLPASELTLCMFATMLAQRIRPQSVNNYLFGVRNLHIMNGLPNPLTGKFLLQKTIRGIKIRHGAKRAKRFPVTSAVLMLLRPWLNLRRHDHLLLWVAMCTATAGLFRIGELTVDGRTRHDPLRLLTIGNLRWADDGASFSILLRVSKTDPFRQEVVVVVGWPEAVKAMREYLRSRGTVATSEPLLANQDGSPLVRTALLEATQTLLKRAKVNTAGYQGVSFRRGGATSLANAGVPDHIIQSLGRWLSDTYKRYIEPSKALLLQYARRL